jgi:hypothetical protein
MNALLVTSLLAVGAGVARQEGRPGFTPKLEGKWLIVYTEEGGRRSTAWERKVATLRGDTLTYEREGEKRSLELAFGPNQTVRAKFSGGGARGRGGPGKGGYHGVYIASRDYLCLSLNPGMPGRAAAEGKHGPSSGSFILILRRQREK